MKAPGITRTRRPFLAPLWVGALSTLVAAFALFGLFRLSLLWLGETTTVILVRHAEKSQQGADPALTQVGEARALRLAAMLRDAGVTAVFASDTLRARATAAPLAARLGLPVEEYAGRDVEGLVAAVADRHRGETVLVVGHSNTVPQILDRLTRGRYVVTLRADEYDAFYLVTVSRFDPPSVLRLRY